MAAVTLEAFYDTDTEWFDGDRAGDSLAETLARVFAAIGDRFGAALLASASSHVVREYYGRYHWHVSIPPHAWAEFLRQEEDGYGFDPRVRRLGGSHLESVESIIVKPRLGETEGWQRKLFDEYVGKQSATESGADTLRRLLELPGE